jgi:Cof subfamily protein (haloacid dehalogenase superfamily)
MASPRLLALDLDGTLLTRGKVVSARTRQVLTELAAEGCHIVVATGRPFEVLALLCEGLPLTAPQVTLNGASIHDPVAGHVLHQRTMATEEVELAVAFFHEREVPLALFTTDGLYLDRRIPNQHLWHPAPLPPPRDLASVGRVRDHEILKVAAHAEPETVDWLHPLAVEVLGEQLYVTRTAPTLVEALRPGVSKGEGLEYVAGLLDVPREGIVAFGDSDNDLPMFAAAGFSVAMGNAAPEAKAAADFITLSNEEDGIVAALEQIDLLDSLRRGAGSTR